MPDIMIEQLFRRKKEQDKQETIRARKLQSALQEIIEALAYPCSFCKDLPRGAENLKHGCDELYGLVIDWDKEIASCPQCKRILAQWDY